MAIIAEITADNMLWVSTAARLNCRNRTFNNTDGLKTYMDDYERLLDRARANVPEDAFKRSGERFNVPKVLLMVQGNRTIWSNFQEIISVLNRPGKEVLKYVSGQLATQTYTIEIRKNDAVAVIDSLTVTNARENHDATKNTDFNEGDRIQFYLNGTADRPLVTAYFRRRI